MIGTILRRARTERSLSQAEVAEISGVKQSNISAIENGRRKPSAETLQRLLAACGFELLAEAGDRVLTFPPPHDTPADDSAPDGDPSPEPPTVDRDTPVADRARVLTAALEASEAIVRGR